MNNNFENKNELKVILCIARNLFFHRSVNGNDVLIITSSFRRGKKEKKNFKFSLFAYCALFFFINKNKKFTKEKKTCVVNFITHYTHYLFVSVTFNP